MRKLVIIFCIAQAYANPLADKRVTSTDSPPRVVIGGVNCVCKSGGSRTRDDYQLSPGIGYHKLHLRAKPWNEARTICIDEGAHLAIINSAAEALILREMVATATDIKGAVNNEWAYIGVHDFFKAEQYTTVLGEPLARTGYEHWLENEPTDSGNIEQCLGFSKRGGLLDVLCNDAHAFFCEIPIAH